MDVGERREPRYSQTPDKEEDQNQSQSQIQKENNRLQNQSGEQAQNLTVVQDPMAGFDAISWMNVEDFVLSDEAFASLPELGCLSSSSSFLFNTSAVQPPKNVLNSTLANSCPSSSSPFSTSSFLRVPNCVPGSLTGCSLEMTMQPQASIPNAAAETQLGMDIVGSVDFLSNLLVPCDSSDPFLDDIPTVDELGACTDQLFNFDLPCPGIGGTNNSSAIKGEEKEEGDDLGKFFLEWLKKNKDDISLEDLRSIRLKKSTIERAAQSLGTGPRGRFELVKLILYWVQTNHLKVKRRRLQAQDSNPNPIFSMGFDTGQAACNSWSQASDSYGFPQSCTTSGGVVNSQPFSPASDLHATESWAHIKLQPTQYGAAPISPLYHQGQNMTSIPSATTEARKKRMARLKRMSSLQKRRALGQSGNSRQCGSVGKGNDDTGDWAFWSSLAAYSEQGMGMMDLSRLSGGSSSSSQTTQTMHGSGHGDSATVRSKGLRLYERDMKLLLQKVLKQSDVGSLGRIVLPKKDAEFHLPKLDSGDGIMIPMEDFRTSCVWNMRYRFWPNNKSRMYILENTGGFIRSNGLEEGDYVVIYSELKSGKYIIKGVKRRNPQEKRSRLK